MFLNTWMYFTNYFFTQKSAQKIMYLFTKCLDLYTHIKTPMLKKYNNIAKKFQCYWGDILDNPLCGMHARREAGSCRNLFFVTSFCLVENFYRPGDIVHALMDPVQLPWDPCTLVQSTHFSSSSFFLHY